MILASAQNAAPAANAPKIQAVFDSVEQQEYCRADSKSYVIFLEVKLHLRNVSSDSVIVASGLPDPAGGNLRPLVAQTRVALSIHDAELGHFFGDLNSAIVTRPMMIVPPIPPIIDIPHSQDFLAIGAGQNRRFMYGPSSLLALEHSRLRISVQRLREVIRCSLLFHFGRTRRWRTPTAKFGIH